MCWILDDREEETETYLILTAVGAETARPQTKTSYSIHYFCGNGKSTLVSVVGKVQAGHLRID